MIAFHGARSILAFPNTLHSDRPNPISIASVVILALVACMTPAFAVDGNPQDRLRFDQDGIDAQVQKAVTDALALYSQNGRGAFDMITNARSSDSDAPIPLVISSSTLKVVAHGAGPLYVGQMPLDVADTSVDQIRASLERDGMIWIEHMETNPENGQPQAKRALLHLHDDGYIFSAGYFLDDFEVQLLIEDVVVQYETYGIGAFDMITPSEPVVTDDLYPFVIDIETWTRVADGVVPDRVGKAEGILNTAARSVEDVRAELETTGSAWVTYTFHNPATDITQLKLSWLYLHDGYVFGSGYYPPDSQVKSLVDSAIMTYEVHGADAFGMMTPDVFDRLSTQSNFVLDAATLEVLAHGRLPALVGERFEQLEAADRPLRDIMAELRSAGGAGTWAWHMDLNPATRTDQLTRTYVVLHGDYIFGASLSLPDIRLQAVIDDALYTYRNDPQNGLDIITSGALNRLDLFPAVRNETHILAHGAVPFLVGPLPPHLRITTGDGGAFSDVPDGTTFWTEFAFFNANTGITQIKRGWTHFYDGYTFVGAYTIADADTQSVTDYARFIYESNRANDAWRDIITPDAPIVTDDLYPFVIDIETWTRLADGVVPGRVDLPERILDTSGRSVRDVVADLRETGSVWLTYTFHNPATGVEQLKRTYLQLKDGLVFGSGYYILDSGVQAVVYANIVEYNTNGRDAALGAIGTIPERPITAYAFAVDPQTGTTVAQGVDPALTGSPLLPVADWDAITAVLPTETIMSTITDAPGMWVNYQHTNPVTGEIETKRTWLVLHDGLVLGSGYYASEIPESDVKYAVSNAINIYNNNKANGAWVDIITPDQPVTTDALYPFVIDADTWTRLADGVVPDRVGQPETILDTSTRSVDDVLAELDEKGSLWVTYIFHNPATGIEQLKRSYLQLHDGLVFGSGYYILDSRVQSLAHGRVLEYERDGRAATLASINTVPPVPITLYAFAVDSATGITLAQNVDPARVGAATDWDVIASAIPESDVLDSLSRGTGAWATYNYISPVTGKPELKHSWLVLHDGLVFGVGHYSSDIPQTDVRFEVRGAIEIYENNKANDAWVDIITPDQPVTTDALYPFVIDADTWTRLADGVVPDRVGQPETILDTSTRSVDDVLAELDEKGSLWVTYIFHNPATGIEQLKRSYLQLHDGLVFGSGYYVLDTDVQSLTHSRVLEYWRDGRAAIVESISVVPDVPDSKYSFVVDSASGTTLAQGVNSASIGDTHDWDAIALAVPARGLLDELRREAGAWVVYDHTSPITGELETKRAWLVFDDGLVFGTGYYSSDIRNELVPATYTARVCR